MKKIICWLILDSMHLISCKNIDFGFCHVPHHLGEDWLHHSQHTNNLKITCFVFFSAFSCDFPNTCPSTKARRTNPRSPSTWRTPCWDKCRECALNADRCWEVISGHYITRKHGAWFMLRDFAQKLACFCFINIFPSTSHETSELLLLVSSGIILGTKFRLVPQDAGFNQALLRR